MYPRGTSSPGSVGATLADLVGRGRQESSGKRLAVRGQETPSLCLFSLGHWGGEGELAVWPLQLSRQALERENWTPGPHPG